MGGTGKSPVVAAVAAWLVSRGERPAILSRGYRRRHPLPGVVVVSDGSGPRAPLAHAGDEPLMLARDVPGAVVVVAEDRHLAGVLAERVLGATIHVLDDGFQHLALARDLDVLVTTPGEIHGGRVLPRGRLREPLDAAARAHVLVVVGATAGAAASEARTLGIGEACGARRRLRPPRAVAGSAPVVPEAGRRVLLVAGIANPQRFAADVRDAGWTVAGEMWFDDHYGFTAADLARVATRMTACGAEVVFTTAKDAVRFEALGTPPFPLFAVPLALEFDPPGLLFARVAAVLDTAAGGRM